MNRLGDPAEVRDFEGSSDGTQRLMRVCPVLLVRDLEAAIAYYRDKVGFEERMRYGNPPTFAIVRRDDCSLMLRTADNPEAIVPLWTVQEMLWNAYFYVDDAAALYRELQERGAHIDYELYDTPYGVREFGIQDHDNYDIGFGQVL